MRLSRLTGLCGLVLACQAVIACDDSDDASNDAPMGGSGDNSAGEGSQASGGSGASAGTSSNQAGKGGSLGMAGDNNGGGGGTDVGGMGQAGMGEAGMGGAPECTTGADCDDQNSCTDDECTEGQCEHTNNTAACDDLSACTPGQDRCADGACSGTRDTTACPACNVPSNIIQNCDFSMGLMHWEEAIAFQGSSATQMVVNGRNVIDIATGGEGIYSVQPRQEPLTIKQGMRYKLRMVAGASVDRDIVMALTQAAAPYKVYSVGDHVGGGFTLHLEEQMKPFEFEFVMVDPDDASVKLEIKLGGAGDDPSIVYFDDVAVEEVKCTNDPSCNDDNPCTADVCDLAQGTCSWTPTTDACTDDGDSCTKDLCEAGQCVHTFDDVACDCSTDEHCNDNNACTDDNCNAGACENTSNTNSCSDNNACTVADACTTGACSGTNVCFDCTAGGNILINCDFANGTTGWKDGFFGGEGTQTVVDGRLVVNITNGGTAPWQIQPRQEALALVAGQAYIMKFNAMASVARTMELSITQDGEPYASYSNQPLFNLTTDMQLFTFNFSMPDPLPAEPVKLEIKLGGPVPNATVPNSVTFDNMFIAPTP